MSGGKVDEILRKMPADIADRVLDHIEGGTSANWIAATLTAHGYPVGATTIKAYRRLRVQD